MAFVFGIFGLIVGSFLNVLILRWNTGRGLLGRSGCLHCKNNLSPYELFPIASWLLQRGRCRKCGVHISWQYPLVELSTGVTFALIGGAPTLSLSYQLLACATSAIFVAIAAYDIKHTIIPDAWVYVAALMALVTSFSSPITQDSTFVVISGPVSAIPLLALWFFSRGRAVGLGDAKLMLAVGWLLGWEMALLSLVLAYIIGAFISLFLLALSSKLWRNIMSGFTPTPTSQKLVWGFTMKSEIPFGQFIIFACLITLITTLYGLDIFAPLGF